MNIKLRPTVLSRQMTLVRRSDNVMCSATVNYSDLITCPVIMIKVQEVVMKLVCYHDAKIPARTYNLKSFSKRRFYQKTLKTVFARCTSIEYVYLENITFLKCCRHLRGNATYQCIIKYLLSIRNFNPQTLCQGQTKRYYL